MTAIGILPDAKAIIVISRITKVICKGVILFSFAYDNILTIVISYLRINPKYSSLFSRYLSFHSRLPDLFTNNFI